MPQPSENKVNYVTNGPETIRTDVLDVICSATKPVRAEATSLLVNSGLWKRLKNQYHAVACCGFVAINQ